MEGLESLLNGIVASKDYYILPAANVQAEVNKITYQADILFWGLAAIVSLAAGYSVYRHLKFLKRRY